MRKKVTITVTKRNFDQQGNLCNEIEKKYELPLRRSYFGTRGQVPCPILQV